MTRLQQMAQRRESVALQVTHFRQLRRVQFGCWLLAGLFAGSALDRGAWPASWIHGAEVPLLLWLIVSALVYFGGNICHELFEINDQLAGRSVELHEALRGGQEDKKP